MAVPDDFGCFNWWLYTMYMNFTVHLIFFELHHSGTQLFLGNVDSFFRHENSPAPFSGRVSTPKAICFRFTQRPQKNSQCADVVFNSTKEAVSVRTLNIEGPHRCVQCKTLICVTLISSQPCTVQCKYPGKGCLRVKIECRARAPGCIGFRGEKLWF